MRPSRWPLWVAALGSVCGIVPAGAQSQFVPPQAPCDLKPRHYLVHSAEMYLHLAGNPRHLDQRPKNLREAERVLSQALTREGQTANPAAWYYLGRYYVETSDAKGGDTAFARAEALAAECRADIDGHRRHLWSGVLAEAFRAWQEGKEDSAIGFFRSAAALIPTNPKSLFPLGEIYLQRQEADSAAFYLGRGADLAATDTVFRRERRSALGALGQLYFGLAVADSSVRQWPRTRAIRDSLERVIAMDSTILGRMQADAAARRSRGASLAPANQRAFSRDSAARAASLAAARQAGQELTQRVTRDQAAAFTRLAPAIAAYRRFLTAYPGDAGAISKLAELYSTGGQAEEAGSFLDSLTAVSPQLEGTTLLDVGHRFAQGNLLRPAVRALSLGLAKHPYHRTGLFELAAVALALRDTAIALPVAQRLVAVDPLNRSSLRLLAGAWEQRAQQDSARKYRAWADSGPPAEVAIVGIMADSSGFTLTIAAINLRPATSSPFSLVFEFLAPDGAIRDRQQVQVPELAPGMSHQTDLRVSGHGRLGWRYRRAP